MSAATPPTPIRVDFVSDVSCPWCAVGLKSLEQAMARIGAAVPVELHFQPFELNPRMPAQGEDADEHLLRKYGSTPQQLERNREAIRARGAELGFVFNRRERIYNTFDAHRLLHWAALEGADRERALKHRQRNLGLLSKPVNPCKRHQNWGKIWMFFPFYVLKNLQ